MFILSITDFIGRFHPALVHLPIGVLLIACMFQLFTRRFPLLKPAVPTMLFWGMLSAVASCITGYLLSLSADYDEALVAKHQWLGIFTAAASLAFYLMYRFSFLVGYVNIMAVAVILFVGLTGHLGGSLTHGTDYITAGLHSGNADEPLKPIPNIQEAILYSDVVQPILQRKCYGCHGSTKQKGKLRLDEEAYVLKGGKDGKVLVSGKPDESEMIKRLLLPRSDDDHMPPKEKPQLTPNEVAVLSWWVSTGNSFTKKVKELPQTDKIKPVLAALQSGSSGAASAGGADVPAEEVGPADEHDVKKLTDEGVMVIPVSNDKNYVSVNFVTAAAKAAELVKRMEPIKKQLVWLKLDGSNIQDSSLVVIGRLTGLTRLTLSNTRITDAGLANLKTLSNLQVLNLVGTTVTEKGVEQLKGLKSLRAIYLYKTHIDRAAWTQLKRSFPKVVLDSGGYQVPIFNNDTTIVRVQQ